MRDSRVRWAARLAGALLLGVAAAAVHAYPAHYLVVREDSSGTLTVVAQKRVDLAGEPVSGKAGKAVDRLGRGLAAKVLDKASGRTVYETRAMGSPWLRGEFHAADGMDAHVLPRDGVEYVVRVPATRSATLRLESAGGGRAGTARNSAARLDIDLDAYAAKATTSLPAGSATGVLAGNGDPANRVDLLIVAEGYTDGQQAQFIADAGRLVDAFFSVSPYADFRHLFNVTWLFAPSAQAGADKPACAETPDATVVSVNTAFDATFCTAGTRRLVTVDNSKVLAAAAAVPEWDEILVLVNDAEYGGSGGPLSVATTNALSAQIMQHEFGHSFTRLADEYETPLPGYPACSDLAGTSAPCEPNVTDDLDRLKWSGWIATGTSVPTIGALSDPLAAGAWAGARFQSSGMYRGCYDGIMRTLGQPFCDVESDAFVKRLYDGGWGTPSTGVSLIEPGEVPAAASVFAPQGSAVAFSAVVAGSRSAAGLTAAWRVDGVTAATVTTAHGATQSFSYVVPDTRAHLIELIVADNTPMTLEPPMRARVWTVNGTDGASGVVPGAPTLIGAFAGNGYATLSFAPPASDGGQPILGYTAACDPGTASATSATSPVTVKGLTNGVTYSCTVAARNANGNGPASAPISVTPLGGSGPALVLSRVFVNGITDLELALARQRTGINF